ncbi:MAG: hypothetical protein BGO70_10485 [Bacteroidetes bacterium 43-93]|nr:MAG: hypothetical protein BGO70_10485 [Bacteroidetes bacterium 43-93]
MFVDFIPIIELIFMKPVKLLLLLLTSAMLFTSCVKKEYYNTQPEPVGYQNIFNDDFNYDNHNWSFSDPANNAYVTVSNGTLKYVYMPAVKGTNTVAINTGANMYHDFLLQTSIQSNNSMGLVFGVSNGDYGYSFFIDDQGYFAVYKEGNANTPYKALLDWQQSNAIKQGWNTVELEQVGNYWDGYINGTKVFEIQAQPLYGSKIGFIVPENTTGYADYLTVQW